MKTNFRIGVATVALTLASLCGILISPVRAETPGVEELTRGPVHEARSRNRSATIRSRASSLRPSRRI